MSGKRILVVDDEELVGDSVRWILQMDGHTVDLVTDASRALRSYKPGKYDLVLTDNRMPKMTGMELVNEIKSRNPAQRILMLTAYPLFESTASVDLVMTKPFSGDALRGAVARLTRTLSKPPTSRGKVQATCGRQKKHTVQARDTERARRTPPAAS